MSSASFDLKSYRFKGTWHPEINKLYTLSEVKNRHSRKNICGVIEIHQSDLTKSLEDLPACFVFALY